MAASGTGGDGRRVTSTILAADTVDVILRDGSTLRLRAPDESDRQALVRFFEQLSERSLYLRFHGRPTIDERLVNPVLDPDWVDRGALMGSVVESGEERVVALANYVRLRDPLTAEVAFAVADAYQGRGIGTRLVEQLAARAAASRSRTFHRRGDGGQRRDDQRLRRRGLRSGANSCRRRGRDDVPDRSHRRVCIARRGT